MTQTNGQANDDGTERQEAIARQILEGIKARLGDGWSNLSADSRVLIAEATTDAAGLQLMALSVANDESLTNAVRIEQAQIDAQLKNLVSVAAFRIDQITEAFWGSVADVSLRVVKKLLL